MRLMSAGKEQRTPQKQAKYRSQKGNRKRKNVLTDAAHPSATHPAPTKALDTASVVLLPVDPSLIHAYWILSPENVATARLPLGKGYERAEAVLRFHANHLSSAGSNGLRSFDVRVDLDAPNWYVHLWTPDKSYYAELGLRSEDGRFFPFARSNVVEMPRVGPAAGEGAHHMLLEGSYHAGEFSIAPSQTGHPAASEKEPFVDLSGNAEEAFSDGSSSMSFQSRKPGA